MSPSPGDALVCCVKRAVPETRETGTAKTTHSIINEVVAVVPPPAGMARPGDDT